MENKSIIIDTTANPAPLGLFGFGMTTVLLNLHNSGLFGLSAGILAMGIFYGGLAQVIAGCMEWKKGNTFGTTAFTSYGFFWLSLVGIWVMPKLGLCDAPDALAMASYLIIWGIFTFILFIGTFKSNFISKFVFGSLTVLFFLLAAAKITGNETIELIAGIEGIICGLSAIYDGAAQIINNTYNKIILPVGKK